MDNREKICRFCFEKCDTNYKAIEGNMHEILNALQVTMNLAISDELVMCTDCSEILQNYFVFKKTYLNIRDHAVAFGSEKNDGHPVCVFCMNMLKNYPFTILNVEEDIEKTMLQKYFPELDLGANKKLAICEVCHEYLANFFSFITNSSIVEEKIKDYCQAEGVNNTDTIKLNNVLKFMSENVWNENDKLLDIFKMEDMVSVKSENKDSSIIKGSVTCASCHGSLEHCSHSAKNCLTVGEKINKCFETLDIHSEEVGSSLGLTTRDVTSEVDGNSTDIIKIEVQFCVDEKNLGEIEIGDCRHTVKSEQLFLDDSQVAIKDVENIPGDSNKLGCIKAEETFCEENETKHIEENRIKIQDQKFLLHEETEIKTNEDDFNRFGDDIVLSQSGFKKHLLVDKDSSAVTMYKCDSCLYQTNRKSNLNLHQILHKDPSEVTVYKCDSCLYQTKYKTDLKKHLILHKDPSEVTMYKCDSCSFQAKRKDVLTSHVILHKNPSDVTTYKCDYCSFQTKHKRNLKNHLLTHKATSEVTMYKCDSCLYQTKFKSNLKVHQTLHKNPSKVAMYKCDSCLYQTKFKSNLKLHQILHKNPSKVAMYKCESCLYQTKRKRNLKIHQLLHKHPSEVTMYKCDSCSFQTKLNYILTRHLLVHKDPSDVTMYKCDCSFQTRYKSSLKGHLLTHKATSEESFQTKNHLLTHKATSEVTMYKCETCLYQTKRKSNLKIHQLLHKHPSEVTMYKCDSCSFQTKLNCTLKRHLLVHKDPSDVTMYKCDCCPFQTRYKSSLKDHLLTHKA